MSSVGPVNVEKINGNIFVISKNKKRTLENSMKSKLLNSVHNYLPLIPGMDGNQCVAHLLLSQAIAFFWLFMLTFSHGTAP